LSLKLALLLPHLATTTTLPNTGGRKRGKGQRKLEKRKKENRAK
jgi:hypothetical protein